MTLSKKAQVVYSKISVPGTKLGDLRVVAKEIKKDHELAFELWNAGELLPRLLAILIMDTKQLTVEVIDRLFQEMDKHPYDERLQLVDWLLANQLTKDKKWLTLLLSWQKDASALKRRLFWYYQGRLRWMGQTSPSNTKELLTAIEERILKEEPEVQWAMNFTAGWIGIFDAAYRQQCIKMGEQLGLYKEEVVHRNCTPNYLPKFIEIEVGKRKL